MNDLSDSDIEATLESIRDEYDSNAVNQVMDEIDVPHLIDRLEGRGGGLRSSKPTTDADDGLTQYVWRMARFHSGDDPCMPVTASWWLREWMENHGIEASVSGIMDDSGKAVTSAIDDVVTIILIAFNKDPAGGAKRWKGLLY